LVQDKFIILCVDDEQNSLALRKLVLEKSGYEVVTAASVNEALARFSPDEFDLVLSDILMPGRPGTDLAREIKTTYPDFPVILLSGVNELPPEASYADAFISKVEGPVRMCEKIAAVLGGHRESLGTAQS
jgi:CheY-like chemotaxis protein